MSFFAGRSRRQREHLFATLRSLGPTTVDGLSAALSWSVRKTDRVLRDALRSGEGGPLRYDPGTGTVSLSVQEAPPGPGVAAPASPAPATAPTLPKAWGTAPRCATCQVPLASTGTGGGLYCPKCGRLPPVVGGARATPAGAPGLASPGLPLSGAPNPPAPPAGPRAAPPTASDRRAQEMFAAWVTAQPIPCPKCRTPLRHRGVAQYGCPACGAQIAFDRSPGDSVLRSNLPSGPTGPGGPTL